MGTVYRKTVTKPVPDGAEIVIRQRKPTAKERVRDPVRTVIVERVARWKSREVTRTATLTTGRDGSERIVVHASKFTAKFRDGSGRVVEKSTGCKDETAARQVLADLERRAELVKAKVITAAEDAIADHQNSALADHVDTYLTHLQASGVSDLHRRNVQSQLRRVIGDCGFTRLGDIEAGAFEKWLVSQTASGMGARTRNTYRSALHAFCAWSVQSDRLKANPLARVEKADEKADRRRNRRALTEAELQRLLCVGRLRPLAERGRETVRLPVKERHGRRTWTKTELTIENIEAAAERARNRIEKPGLIQELERTGHERALVYKTFMLTGLRKGELASITVGQTDLESVVPCIILNAADEKSREGSNLPLRADLVDELRAWLAERLEVLRRDCLRSGESVPARLPNGLPLFDVPNGLVRILNRDLKAAGIEKVDERGRSLDVHALRHTFGTHLSKGGVAPRTAQALMRHSDIDLTMNVYTDPKLLDGRAALDSLPTMPIDAFPNDARLRATGTVGESPRKFAPGFAPTPDFGGRNSHSEARSADLGKGDDETQRTPKPLQIQGFGNACHHESQSGRRDSNSRHPAWEASALPTELRPRGAAIYPWQVDRQ